MEHLPSIYEALSWIPSTNKEGKKMFKEKGREGGRKDNTFIQETLSVSFMRKETQGQLQKQGEIFNILRVA